MKWEWALDRTPKGNVVQLRCGPLVVRIPQRTWQEVTDSLFPAPAPGTPVSRWDVGTFEDMTREEQLVAQQHHAFTWR